MNRKPLAATVQELKQLFDSTNGREEEIMQPAAALIENLVASDSWLPDTQAQPHPDYYQQYPLYIDPQDRFSLVSFVWGPGQTTPVHDHTVWGVIGMLRGAEIEQRYHYDGPTLRPSGTAQRLEPGQISCVSPNTEDIHKVSNAYTDQVSISVHLYGGNIGKIKRSVYDESTGGKKQFISGYADTLPPLL